jgi:hypothetical protein
VTYTVPFQSIWHSCEKFILTVLSTKLGQLNAARTKMDEIGQKMQNYANLSQFCGILIMSHDEPIQHSAL